MSGIYVQVLLPLSLRETYTYKVPSGLAGQIRIGQRVIVQFGKKKYYSALITSIVEEPPEKVRLKEIVQVLDEQPVVFSENFKLWHWMADYYCCSLGDVYRAALPPGLKLESSSKVSLAEDDRQCKLTDNEQLIVDELITNSFSIHKLQHNLGEGFSFRAFNNLLEKGIIKVDEKIINKYKPKVQYFVGFDEKIKTGEQLNTVINSLDRAKKQQALLLHFCDKIDFSGSGQKSIVSKKELLEGTDFSDSVLKALVRKQILTLSVHKISRIRESELTQNNLSLLTGKQEKAISEVKSAFNKGKVALVHGITSSGKTEIYIHLIDEIIRSGQQALYMVPEIALTTQITGRLQNIFGNKVGIYHSRFNSQERVEIWQKVISFRKNPETGFQVILGTRSAIFLPFSDLGLIIVDEEHENSFKQHDPAPRYNARDMAVTLGSLTGAKVVLGSATPSYESYFNAISGKYSLVNLTERYLDTGLPEIIVADLKRARKKKQMRFLLTQELYELTEKALANHEQVILFQNRRGYSSFVQCFDCGWVPMCTYCDVSLTFHKYKNELNCHYCGYTRPVPVKCESCGSSEIKTRGSGTEKIEEDLKILFPQARVERMDLDTTRSKNAFARIISNLELRKTDILVGTQMVVKGFDFDHVSVAGVLNADYLSNFPDFRAHERTFQLICQVGGRAGRRSGRGKVVIQTSQPSNPLYSYISNYDYKALFNSQMEERKIFGYPPWCRLIKIIIKHRKIETVNKVATVVAEKLRLYSIWRVLGPEYPLISRIQSLYNKEIWLKIGRDISPARAKSVLMNTIREVRQKKDCSSCIINIDVDPM